MDHSRKSLKDWFWLFVTFISVGEVIATSLLPYSFFWNELFQLEDDESSQSQLLLNLIESDCNIIFILLNKGRCIGPTLQSVFLSLEIVFGLITVINSEYLARYSSLNLHFYDNHQSVDWMDSEECKITWPTTAESRLGRKWFCVRNSKI